ncbi:LAR-like protein [Mya arenaria]|uniref:protein-tyrosine-phosphatase n=1 Tax=Mya arenaria TaxID=6604 RepID=A0ABY7F883_MYAAR|nr:LAR-like protein [Mya arenaria]
MLIILISFSLISVVVCERCPPGKYGDQCDLNCTYLHCFCSSQFNCELCEPGYFNTSIFCKNTCIPSTCTCTDYTNCHSCIDGHYGLKNKCNQNCSALCHGTKCYNDGTCVNCKPNFTGSNCDSCVDGRYGANCALQCSQGCEGNNCKPSDGSCNCRSNYSGDKCENCIADRYGEDCSKECSPGCIQNTCSSTDGKCNCKEFYTGENCDVCVDGRYGENTCDQKCSFGCNKKTCSRNGTCICKPNFTGNKCDSCVNGVGCDGNNCSHIDGKCICKEFYTGDKCDVCVDWSYGDATWNESTEGEKLNVGAAIGVSIAAVLLLVAVIVAVIILKQRNELCWKKRRDEEQHSEVIHTPQPVVYATVPKNRHSSVPAQQMESNRGNQAHHPRNKLYEDISNGPDDSGIIQKNVKQETEYIMQTHQVQLVMTEETTEDDGLENDEDDQIARARAITFEEKGGIYYNNADKINNQKIAVNNLTKYVIEKTVIDIEEEFEKFPYGLTKSYAVSQKLEHSHRNRYKGIYPYDDTRVKLRDCQTDYINASFINGYNKRHAYIAALGPMSKQLGDFSPFWQMIWQEKVEKIVMLTNLVEDGKDKCEQYWPPPGTSKNYGMHYISCLNENEYADYKRREFTISKGRETRELHHLHFTCWPDKDVPEDVTGITEFRQRVQNIPSQFDGPVLVHCRALVCSLSDISKPIRGKYFRQYMRQMGNEDFDGQFQEMQTVLEKPSDNEMHAVERNKIMKGKNRPFADIPGDLNRPCLFLNNPPGASGYINAVYIDKQNVGLYYPAGNHVLKQGMFQVSWTKQENHGYCTKRLLAIKHNEPNGHCSEREVTHFEFNTWDNTSDIPRSTKDYLDLIKSVDANIREVSNRGPVLVHCLDGAGKSALFCVVSILIEKMDIYQEVSVVNTIRKVKSIRKSAIPTKAQFEFCHECVLSYMKSFEYGQYANFTARISSVSDA